MLLQIQNKSKALGGENSGKKVILGVSGRCVALDLIQCNFTKKEITKSNVIKLKRKVVFCDIYSRFYADCGSGV